MNDLDRCSREAFGYGQVEALIEGIIMLQTINVQGNIFNLFMIVGVAIWFEFSVLNGISYALVLIHS